MLHDILSMYRNGDVIPFVILAFVCIGFVVVIEKFILLQVVYGINFEKYNRQMKKLLLAGEFAKARTLSRSTSKTGVPMLVLKACEAYEADSSSVKSTVTEEGLKFFPTIRRRLNHLPNLAASCVILGSIATVHGIWTSFQVVEGLEANIKSLAFSAGLSHALLPLAVSLLAALLLMLPFGLLDSIASRLENRIEHSLCIILNILIPESQEALAAMQNRQMVQQQQAQQQQQMPNSIYNTVHNASQNLANNNINSVNSNNNMNNGNNSNYSNNNNYQNVNYNSQQSPNNIPNLNISNLNNPNLNNSNAYNAHNTYGGSHNPQNAQSVQNTLNTHMGTNSHGEMKLKTDPSILREVTRFPHAQKGRGRGDDRYAPRSEYIHDEEETG